MAASNVGELPESAACGEADGVAAATAVSPGTLVGRAQAARLLGVSKSTLRRMEGEYLTPVVGPKNVRLFQEEQIHSLVVRRRLESGGSERTSGEVAAEVFELFDENSHPVDVVKRLRLDPDVVETLHQRWISLRAMLVLSRDTIEALWSVFQPQYTSDFPYATNEADFLDYVKRWASEQRWELCEECFSRRAAYCPSCAKRWGLREQKRLVLGRKHQP